MTNNSLRKSNPRQEAVNQVVILNANWLLQGSDHEAFVDDVARDICRMLRDVAVALVAKSGG